MPPHVQMHAASGEKKRKRKWEWPPPSFAASSSVRPSHYGRRSRSRRERAIIDSVDLDPIQALFSRPPPPPLPQPFSSSSGGGGAPLQPCQPAIGHRLSACTEGGGGSLCAELPRPLYARGGRRKKWPILGGWIILRAAKRPRGNALVVPSTSSRNIYWPTSRGLAPAPIAIILSRINDISTGGGALPSFFLSGFGLGGLPIPIRIPLQLSSFRLFLPAPFPPSIIRPLPPPSSSTPFPPSSS